MYEYYQGFSTLQEEINNIPLEINGEIPEWLKGTFIHNGPAKFEIGDQKLNHWFDGYAMLHRFRFDNAQVYYTNAFLKSDDYQQSIKKQKICFPEFATNPKHYFFRKPSPLKKTGLTDNTNINTIEINGKLIAMTETARYLHYDPMTLETLGHFEYNDTLKGYLTTAHPQQDPVTKEIFNLTIQMGKISHYNFYKIAQDSDSRQQIASIAVKKPAYLHSFAMTENYLILIEPPLRCTPLNFLFSRKPFIENYRWTPKKGTRITVFEKQTAQLICRDVVDAFFMFHQINAFEAHENVYIDLCTYDDPSIIEALYLNNLAENPPPLARPERLSIELSQKKIVREKLSDCYLEFPRINQKNNGRVYQYTYGTSILRPGDFLNQLIKLDVTEGTYQVWSRPYCYPSEPVFVQNPEDNTEDGGVVLSIVLDSESKKSFLLILDATSFQELARCVVPHVIPFGLHGVFF